MTTSLAGLNLSYMHRRRRVLHDVSIAVRPSQVTLLTGPNGSGKSTLLWLMAGLRTPASGRVVLCNGQQVPLAASHSLQPRDSQMRDVNFPLRGLAMVFQQEALWEHLTVQEHLGLVLTSCKLGRPVRRSRVDAVLERMHLTALRSRRPGELSGGERQRLALARALVIEPDWLLLDEPLAHLDGPSREQLLNLLRESLAGSRAGVLLAAHDCEETLPLADEVVVLLDGHLAQQGKPADVYFRPTSLEAARVLGPACELAGTAGGGRLRCGDTIILEELDGGLAGPQKLILRHEQTAFNVDGGGAAVIVRCDWARRGFLLEVHVAGQRVVTWSQHAVAPGMAGRLTLVNHHAVIR